MRWVSPGAKARLPAGCVKSLATTTATAPPSTVDQVSAHPRVVQWCERRVVEEYLDERRVRDERLELRLATPGGRDVLEERAAARPRR